MTPLEKDLQAHDYGSCKRRCLAESRCPSHLGVLTEYKIDARCEHLIRKLLLSEDLQASRSVGRTSVFLADAAGASPRLAQTILTT